MNINDRNARVTFKKINCYQVFVNGALLGDFKAHSEWNGMIELKKMSGEMATIIATSPNMLDEILCDEMPLNIISASPSCLADFLKY